MKFDRQFYIIRKENTVKPRFNEVLDIANNTLRPEQNYSKMYGIEPLGVGGGGLLGSIFAGYVPLASQNPYPIIVYSVANYRPHLSHFWANVIFAIPT